jgi:hypothetical protein
MWASAMVDLRTQRKRVDALFAVHTGVSAFFGALAFILPHLFEYITIHHGETLSLRDNADEAQKPTHTIVRL